MHCTSHRARHRQRQIGEEREREDGVCLQFALRMRPRRLSRGLGGPAPIGGCRVSEARIWVKLSLKPKLENWQRVCERGRERRKEKERGSIFFEPPSATAVHMFFYFCCHLSIISSNQYRHRILTWLKLCDQLGKAKRISIGGR